LRTNVYREAFPNSEGRIRYVVIGVVKKEIAAEIHEPAENWRV